MKKLGCFCLGAVSIIAIMPIIEGITETICTANEVAKGVLAKKVMVLNKEIQDLQAKLEGIEDPNVIGFEAPNEEYYYDEDEEWEEDKKNKIGF